MSDVFGRLSLFSVYVALNRVGISKSCAHEPEDSLGSLVGMMWLNTDRNVGCLLNRWSRHADLIPDPSFSHSD